MESATSTTIEPRGTERVIEPPKGVELPNLRELWERRDLLYFMAYRDIAVRYKQALIGAFWAVLQPILLAGIFAVFFGILAKVDSAPGIPYPLFVLSGFVIWLYFAMAVTDCALSTLASSTLISKVYFPRLVIPLAAVIPATVDFFVGFFVVVIAAWAYGFEPTLKILALPGLLALTFTTILGAGLWLSALNVKYRDVVLLVPFLTQIGLFISPVVYPIDLVPENLQAVYLANPTAGILELYRWIILPTDFPGMLLLIPIAVSIVLLVTGSIYFKRAEREFADVI